MEAPTPAPSPFMSFVPKRLSLVLFFAALTVVFSTGCESMRCYTCPDARNQSVPPPAKA